MSDSRYSEMYEVILEVIEPKLTQAGVDKGRIGPDTNLSDILDSFGILDAIMDIEQRAGVNADIGQMDFEVAMTVGGLAREIVRINPAQ